MKAFYYFLFIVSISLFFSCQEEEKVPDYVWNEEQFVEVLTEFQMAEAIVRLGYHRREDSMYYNDSVYNAAFRKFNVSEAEFDSNYNYYLKNPKKLEEMYDVAITNLSTRLAEFESKNAQSDSLE